MTARVRKPPAPGIFLRAARLADAPEMRDVFPWTVPCLGAFASLAFASPVTLVMGENGCGKSTLLEALAIAARAVAIGGADLERDPSLAGSRTFARALGLTWSARRPAVRLFFRAEDALGFGRRVTNEMRELGDIATALDETAERPDAARRRAAGYVRGQRAALAGRYGDDPHALSHGESFARILGERIVPNGIYFFDEPETPLSPTRVLALLVSLRAAVRNGSQFVIATHSPILAAFPGAAIYAIDGARIAPVPFAELEHVRITRDFLNAPERYLRRLEEDAPADDA